MGNINSDLLNINFILWWMLAVELKDLKYFITVSNSQIKCDQWFSILNYSKDILRCLYHYSLESPSGFLCPMFYRNVGFHQMCTDRSTYCSMIVNLMKHEYLTAAEVHVIYIWLPHKGVIVGQLRWVVMVHRFLMTIWAWALTFSWKTLNLDFRINAIQFFNSVYFV